MLACGDVVFADNDILNPLGEVKPMLVVSELNVVVAVIAAFTVSIAFRLTWRPALLPRPAILNGTTRPVSHVRFGGT